MNSRGRQIPPTKSSVTDLISHGSRPKVAADLLMNSSLTKGRPFAPRSELESVESKGSKCSDGSRTPSTEHDYELDESSVQDEDDFIIRYDELWLVTHLTRELESILRDAKESHLGGCWQVLLPRALTSQVAQDMMGLSDCEPCGIRGCVLFVDLDDEGTNRTLGRVIMSAETVPTFEMRLTLRRNSAGWLTAMGLNRLMRSLGRDSLVISDNYCLRKKRLYR